MKITKIIAAFMVAGLIGAIGCGAEEEVGTPPTDAGTDIREMGGNDMGEAPADMSPDAAAEAVVFLQHP